MKYTSILIIVLAALLGPLNVGAQELEQISIAGNITPCDGVVRDLIDTSWVNTAEYPMAVHSVLTWIGVDGGAVVDTYATVFRDGFALDFLGFDRYAQPNGLIQKEKTFQPPITVTVNPGQRIYMQHMCKVYNRPDANSQAFAVLWLYRK